MIDQIEKDYFEVYCDFCNHEEEFGDMDFYEVVQTLKEYGWKIFKKDGEWNHKCPECAKDFDVYEE